MHRPGVQICRYFAIICEKYLVLASKGVQKNFKGVVSVVTTPYTRERLKYKKGAEKARYFSKSESESQWSHCSGSICSAITSISTFTTNHDTGSVSEVTEVDSSKTGTKKCEQFSF